MRFIEYGKENKDVIMLLHGGGLSWWNYREVAELLQTDFRVILPILDGHSGSDSDFTTIEDNADRIISFIDENFGGSVLFLGGLSLGGQVLLEILSRRKDICRFAIVESALVMPSKLTYSMIKPAFGSCYGLIQYKWFSKLQFNSLKIKSDLFDYYYRDTCAISKEDMIAFLQELQFCPLTENGVFCQEIVDSEKRNLLSAIAAQKNDKRAYASAQMLKIMCKGDSFGVPRLGEKEDVETITPESLYAHYRSILRTSPIEIFYVGSAEQKCVADMLMPMLAKLDRDYVN